MNKTPIKGWTTKKLNELGCVGRGKSRHRPRNDSSLYGGEYPFIQTGEIKSANLYISGYSQTYNDKGLAQSKLWEPGTLCITIAANIAETAILKIPACFPDSVVGFTADRQKSDVRFIKYSFDILKQQMQNISRGTTQDNFSLDKLLSFDFFTPPLPTQGKIAAILSAYDDLIENNLRRIKILEEMAQTLYREWFVKFLFPGHEKVNMVDSPLGMIPEGWDIMAVEEVCETVIRGVTPEYSPGSGRYIINQKANQGMKLDIANLKELSQDLIVAREKYAHREDLLVNSLGEGTMGRVFFFIEPHQQWAVDQHMTICRSSKKGFTLYLYLLLSSPEGQARLQLMRTGATNMTMLNISALRKMDFLFPDMSLLEMFYNQVILLFDLKDRLTNKQQNLRRTRDLLLPKLISGEIDVSDLDIKVEEAA